MKSLNSLVGRALLILCGATLLSACATTRPNFNALVVFQEYEGTKNYPSIDTWTDAKQVFLTLTDMNRADVQLLDTVSQVGWDRALDTFLKKFPQGRVEDAVIYVAAHGIRGEDGWTDFVDSRGRPVAMEPLLEKVMKVARASIIFIDICRTPAPQAPDQETKQETRSALERKVAQMAKQRGLRGNQAVILFSTDAGNVAADGSGNGSAFAQAFIKEFPKRQELRVTLRQMVLEVNSEKELEGKPVDHNRQNPWPYGLITFDVFPAGRPSSGGAT